MRRTLFLLAVLLAGSWGERAAPPTSPAPELHQLADAANSSPLAFLRAGYSVPFGTWQDGPDSAARAGSRRASSHASRTDFDSAAIGAAFATREVAHLDHAAPFALLRAGRASFHTATPPPFRSV